MPFFCQFDELASKTRCCTRTHDTYIKNSIEDLWPSICAKDEYPGLEKLVCLACHPEQPQFTHIEGDTKIIRVCKSLLQKFYGAELDKPTDKFEKCGAWNDPDSTLTPVDVNDPNAGYMLDTPDPRLIFPKSEFKNAQAFYKDFDQAGIPFFGDFEILMVDDTEDKDVICYDSAIYMQVAQVLSLVSLLALV